MTGGEDQGPVPVRDLLRQMQETPSAEEPEPAAEPPAPEYRFQVDDEGWIVRVAGEGTYGTGRVGGARLLAVHFFAEADPETPLKEALIPAGAFPTLADEEFRSLLKSATPIDLER